MIDQLLTGPYIPHSTNGATAVGATAVPLSATAAASYVTTGNGSATVSLTTNRTSVRFAWVFNASTAGQIIYVNVGNTVSMPPTATAGSFALAAGERHPFAIPDAAHNPTTGMQGYLNLLASAANGSASVQWVP